MGKQFDYAKRYVLSHHGSTLPGTIIADAGYGGEENYAYLESEQLEALLKFKEKSKAWKKDISKIDNWQYDETEDTWTCTAGQKLVLGEVTK